MNLVQMPERQRLRLRKNCLKSLFRFCIAVMGYDDLSPGVHQDYCDFLQSPGNRKQTTMPRSYVKTWIGSVAYPVWATLNREEEEEFPYYKAWEDKYWTLGTNLRLLIASYVITNAEKMISLVRKTYESNSAMQMLFPEVIPANFNKIKWSNQSACINRIIEATENTFEAAGIGGASVSRHYDGIIEDDLIYANKDDLTGRELQPNQEDIDKAIGWHKLVTSLLVPGKHTRIHNAGTRWAKHDLVDYIWRNEPQYKRFIRGCVDLEELGSGKPWRECTPSWVECYDIKQLEMIANAQGPYMFATQYLLRPMSPEEMLFKPAWLQYYVNSNEVPKDTRVFTTVDLSGWGTQKRSRQSRAVVITCGWDSRNHLWILHYDVGRFNPSKVIELMVRHYKVFQPEVLGVESVYYQNAIAHFARRQMEEGKIPWMPIRAIKPEGGEKKEARIRALEPIAFNLAIHCKPSHKEFIEEFSEYVPNSDVCLKDILDALAYQVQLARPGEVIPIKEKGDRNSFVPVGNMDSFLRWAWDKGKPEDRFGNRLVEMSPYGIDDLDKIIAEEVDVSYESYFNF